MSGALVMIVGFWTPCLLSDCIHLYNLLPFMHPSIYPCLLTSIHHSFLSSLHPYLFVSFPMFFCLYQLSILSVVLPALVCTLHFTMNSFDNLLSTLWLSGFCICLTLCHPSSRCSFCTSINNSILTKVEFICGARRNPDSLANRWVCSLSIWYFFIAMTKSPRERTSRGKTHLSS